MPRPKLPPGAAPWQFAYFVLGLLTNGLLPFLLPLSVAAFSARLDAVAYVTGAYNIGLLAAPFLGRLAERHRLYRLLFFGSFVVLAVTFAAFPMVTGMMAWFLLALMIGVTTGGAATIASLLVVNFTPEAEWEWRIGGLQSLNGAGQLAGLLLAGVLAARPPGFGFQVGAGLAVLAVLVGGIRLPRDGRRHSSVGPLRQLGLQPVSNPTQAGPAIGGLLQHSQHLSSRAARPHSRRGADVRQAPQTDQTQSNELRNRRMLKVSIASPSRAIAPSCGQRSAIPMPFRKTARITTRK